MDNSQKNVGLITDLETKLREVEVILSHFEENFSNKESSQVCLKLKEATHWIKDQIESLK